MMDKVKENRYATIHEAVLWTESGAGWLVEEPGKLETEMYIHSQAPSRKSIWVLKGLCP